VLRLARQGFRAHHDRDRVKAFNWFAGRNAVGGGNEGIAEGIKRTAART
jgi:hypothetical protein